MPPKKNPPTLAKSSLPSGPAAAPAAAILNSESVKPESGIDSMNNPANIGFSSSPPPIRRKPVSASPPAPSIPVLGTTPDPEPATLHKDLENLGYTIDRVIYSSGGGTHARYLKATDRWGHTSYIELDVDAAFPLFEDQGSFDECSSSSLPGDYRMGMYTCVGLKVSGIVIESGDTISVVCRNDRMEPKELTFRYIGSNLCKGVPIPYPLIKASDVLRNPKLVMEYVSESISKVRNITFEAIQKDLTELYNDVKQVVSEVNLYGNKLADFYRDQGRYSKDLYESTKELSDYAERFEKQMPLSVDNMTRYRKVSFNLKKRHELMLDLFDKCEFVSRARSGIDQIKVDLGRIKGELDGVVDSIGEDLKEIKDKVW